MSQWSFVIAAYAVTSLTVLGLIGWAYATMRRAEAAADTVKRAR